MKPLLAALALVAALGATPAYVAPAAAANADHPNQNVDPRLDKGGDTGNSRVDSLNNGQLDQNQGVRNPGLGSRETTPPPAVQQR